MVLLIGANPRFDAPVIHSRMRKCWTYNELDLALDGPKVDLTYDYDHLGDSTDVLQQLADGTHPYSARLPAAKAPVGSESLQREDDGALMRLTQ